MMDLYLKFESAAEAEPHLYDVVEYHVDADGIPVSPDKETGEYPEGSTVKTEKRLKFTNTDIIGDIWKPTGETTEKEGPGGMTMVVPVMEKLPGYHVNIRVMPNEDPADLEPFAIVPTNPVRVWA